MMNVKFYPIMLALLLAAHQSRSASVDGVVKPVQQKITLLAQDQPAMVSTTRTIAPFVGENALAWAVIPHELAKDSIARQAEQQPDSTASGKPTVVPAPTLTPPAPNEEDADPFTASMVFIEGGTFQMGQPNPDVGCEGCNEDEQPVHVVAVNGFYMSKYEVTQRQWERIMGENPSYFNDCGDCPVEQVSWDDAQEFIRRLNARTGKNYRLPTEAEWEYAARGREGDYEPVHPRELKQVAWFGEEATDEPKPRPVGQKIPNSYGLYDMAGNVWEWCSDWYAQDYYTNSPFADPKGPAEGTYRVLRGGSWSSNPHYCRPTNRFVNMPDNRFNVIGFRLVR